MGMCACAQNLREKMFKLSQLDSANNPGKVDIDLAYDIFLQRTPSKDSRVKGINRHYEEDMELLWLQIPEEIYHTGHFWLYLVRNASRLGFADPKKGFAIMPLNENDPINVRLISRKNPYYDFLVLGNTKFIDSIIFAQKTARIAANGKAVDDSVKKVVTRRLGNDSLLKKMEPTVSTYFAHEQTSDSWINLYTDFMAIEVLPVRHAFFEARYLSQHYKDFRLLTDSIRQAVGSGKITLTQQGIGNLQLLDSFMENPDKHLCYDCPGPDLQLFYQSVVKYFVGYVFGRSYNSTPGEDSLRPVIIQPLGKGIEVTSLVDGVAEFLIRRVQDELSAGYKFRLVETIGDLSSLFPNFTSYISSVNFQLSGLSMVAKRDMESLPRNILQWTAGMPDSRPNKYLSAFSDLVGFYTGKGDSVGIENLFGAGKKTHVSRIDIVSMLSANLRDTGVKNTWIPLKLFDSLDDRGKKYFTFFLYRQDPVLFKTLDSLGCPLDDYKVFTGHVRDMLAYLIDNGKALRSDDYKKRVAAIDKIYPAAYELLYSGGGCKPVDSDLFYRTVTRFLESSRTDAPYGPSVDIKYILRKILGTRFDTLAARNDAKDYNLLLGKIKKTATLYSFIRNLTYVKSSDDVQKAADMAALPVGSYVISRIQPFSLQLQGYAGVAVSSRFVSPEIPIGLAASVTMEGKPPKKPWLLSEDEQIGRYGPKRHTALLLFLQVVDLGNPLSAATRKNVGGSTFSRLSWSNVFNPGASIGIGFKNMPIVLLGGLTYNENIDHQRAVMAKFSIDIDMPIWHLRGRN